MDTVLAEPWTTERFLAREDRQEGKHEFDGSDVVQMTGGSIAHQRIVFNLTTILFGLLADSAFTAIHAMRLRIGSKIRYPDVLVCAMPQDQTIKTLSDAIAIFEVLSDDTATTDRVIKLQDYTDVPSLQIYVLLEQSSIGATVFQRTPGGAWIATPHTGGAILLDGLDTQLPLADVYRGLTFPA